MSCRCASAAVLGLALTALLTGCRPSGEAGGPDSTPGRSVDLARLFWPPAGAQVLYRDGFYNGSTDGWHGELVTPANRLPGTREVLKVGGGREWTSRKLKFTVAEETVLSFYLYTEDCPYVFVQCNNEALDDNFKSYYYLYPNVHYGKWTHIYWPLNGTLVDSSTNHVRTVRVGDVLSDVQIHLPKGATILLDRICLYSMDAPAKVKEAMAELRRVGGLVSVPFTKQNPSKPPPRNTLLAERLYGQEFTQLRSEGQKLQAQPALTWNEAKAFWERATRLAADVDRFSAYHEKARGIWRSVVKESLPLDYAVGTQHAMDRLSDLHWMYPFTGDVTGFHQLHAARNEYESFQAVVLPFGKDLKGVQVGFNDLRRLGGGGVIAASNCTWRTQPYVQLLPTFGYPGYDWIAPKPDPLLPGAPFDLPAGRWAPLWITVYTPPDAPPGDYEGVATIKAANSHDLPVKIRLHVWDYHLPLTGRFRTQTSFGMVDPAKWYGREVTPEWRREWEAWMLSYRFTPTEQYGRGFSPHPDDIEFCRQRGNNIWILAGLAWAKKASDIPLDTLRQRYELARQAGILPYCHVYIGDESGDFALMRQKANLIHANFPGLKVMIGGSTPRKELVGYIDIWDPIMNPGGVYGFDPALMRAAQDRGEETMWYVAAAPQHPYPNVHMGDPLLAARMTFWLSWKYNITGFEYYCFSIWRPNFAVQPRWPKSTWITYSWDHANGDGQLCYPGPDGRPAASVRLEAIRDGVEDWEAMFILQGASEALQAGLNAGAIAKDKSTEAQALLPRARRALAIDDAFCKDTTHWALDPAGLHRRRNEVSSLIEAIVNVVGKRTYEAFQARRVAERQALEAGRLDENRRRAIAELATQPVTLPATQPATRPAIQTATAPSSTPSK